MTEQGNGLEGRGLSFGPAPASFDMTAVQTGGRDAQKAGRGGVCHWLTHVDHDLTGPDPVITHRSFIEVTGSDGLQPAAQVAVTFDPRNERVVIHAIRVHRGGQVRDAADPGAFELIQRELNMERAVYDGHRTAHMVIPDVRVGDQVEVCTSVIGQNPALKGAFSTRFILQWDVPMLETRCVVRVPSGRKLAIKTFGSAPDPVDTDDGTTRTLTWRVIDKATYQIQPFTPMSYTGYAVVRIADDMSWAQVADIFRDAYEPGPLPGELADQVAGLASETTDAGERLIRGLHLVQDMLRYHSVSLGEGGYRPRSLEHIWATRYGDCKDGSVMLTAVLRALGIDAVCALVNTFVGDALDTALPNVGAFNHCIVRARVGGKTVWLDSTLGHQGGDLNHLSQPDFHWALPLVPQAGLEQMPPPPLIVGSEVEEIWTLPQRSDLSADLEITSINRGGRADAYRRWLANEGRDRISERLKSDLEPLVQSQLDSGQLPEFTDDRVGNELRIHERYYVQQPFVVPEDGAGLKRTHETFVSRDEVVGGQLPQLGPETRREPIALGQPRRTVLKRTIRFPVDMGSGGEWDEVQEGPGGLKLKSVFKWQGRREALHTLDLTVPQAVIPADKATAYREFYRRARDTNAVVFRLPVKGNKFIPATKGRGNTWTRAFWWTVAAFFILSAIGRLITGLANVPAS